LKRKLTNEVVGREIVSADLKVPVLELAREASSKSTDGQEIPDVVLSEPQPARLMGPPSSRSHRRTGSSLSQLSLAPTEISTSETPIKVGNKRLASRELTPSSVSIGIPMGAPRRKPQAVTDPNKVSIGTPIKFNGELGSTRSLGPISSSLCGPGMEGKKKNKKAKKDLYSEVHNDSR
jgi:hypothetical protein